MHFLCGFVLHNGSRMLIWRTKWSMLSYNGWYFGIFLENGSVVILGAASITVLLTESCLNKEQFALQAWSLSERISSFKSFVSKTSDFIPLS